MTRQTLSTHTYPHHALRSEFLSGLVVAAIAVGLALLVPAFGVAQGLLLAVVVGAVVYLGSAALRAVSKITLTDSGLILTKAGPLSTPMLRSTGELRWDRLIGLQLRYFSTRRDHSGGWFELTVKDDRASITVSSSISGFEHILEAAEQAAAANSLSLSEVTRTNLARFTKAASAPAGLRAVLRRAA